MKGPVPLRVSIPVVLLLAAVVLAGAGAWHEVTSARREIEEEARRDLESLGVQVTNRLEYQFGKGDLAAVAFSVTMTGTDPDVGLALVVDEGDRIVAATDPALKDRPLGSLPMPGPAALVARARAEGGGQTGLRADGRVLGGAFGFDLGLGAGNANAPRVGVLYLETDLAWQLLARLWGVRQRALLQALLIVLSLFAAWVYLDRALTQRVALLARATREIAAGRLGTRVPFGGRDELAELGEAVNRMAASIEERTGALRASEQRYAAIFKAETDAILLADAETGLIREANDAAVAVFGYPREELVGMPFGYLSAAFDADELAGDDAVIRFTAREHRRKDGSCFVAEVSARRLEIGGVPHILEAVRDVTERRKAEEELDRHRRHLEALVAERTAEANATREAAEAASRAKSAFLASMSHEIRTPMNSVLGFSQLLLRDAAGLPERVRSQVEAIHRNGEHLQRLIDDILEMSRIESGRTKLVLGDVDLHRLLDDVEAMFRLRLEEKGLGFVVQRSVAVPARIVADGPRLRQVLVNLVGNAEKFTTAGSVSIRVDARPTAGDACRLTVEVEDTGPGIHARELSRIFGQFEQAEAGVTAKTGTGLGLAISQGLARLMGGDITLRSEVGVGSTFTVELPVTLPARTASGEEPSAPRILGLPPGTPPPRVVVADDVAENRTILADMLRRVGIEVRAAADGREALALHRLWAPDLVLMDLKMPVVDGFEAIRRIRASEQGRRVPIVAVSASVFEESRREAKEAGADDFLVKPFREQDLLSKVGRLLGIPWVYEEGERPDGPGTPAGPGGAVSEPPSR